MKMSHFGTLIGICQPRRPFCAAPFGGPWGDAAKADLLVTMVTTNWPSFLSLWVKYKILPVFFSIVAGERGRGTSPVADVGGDAAEARTLSLNVRFRPAALRMFRRPKSAKVTDRVSVFSRSCLSA